VISAHNLTKSFGRTRALWPLDLEVSAGETVALLGPNGAGKTTLLRLLATLDKPTAGQLQIAGVDALRDRQSVRAQLGLVAHQTFLHPELTAMEELTFYGQLYGAPEPRTRADELLDQFGLLDRADSRIGALSRGQQQRLSIARALLHDPAVLLLDEPDTGLDAGGMAVLEGLLGRRNRTIVFSSHNRAWATGIAGRSVGLVNGRLE
jgi:heme exporter protein A